MLRIQLVATGGKLCRRRQGEGILGIQLVAIYEETSVGGGREEEKKEEEADST